HFGTVFPDGTSPLREVPTSDLDRPNGTLATAIRAFAETQPKSPAFAFCSVVPKASERLRSLFSTLGLSENLFQLTCDVELGMPISYPRPSEIGQDRLANAVAATAKFPLPCIVIDMGT